MQNSHPSHGHLLSSGQLPARGQMALKPSHMSLKKLLLNSVCMCLVILNITEPV